MVMLHPSAASCRAVNAYWVVARLVWVKTGALPVCQLNRPGWGRGGRRNSRKKIYRDEVWVTSTIAKSLAANQGGWKKAQLKNQRYCPRHWLSKDVRDVGVVNQKWCHAISLTPSGAGAGCASSITTGSDAV